MTDQTEIQLTQLQKVFIGVVTSMLASIAVGALGIAWNTREMVVQNSARLDYIERTRFTHQDAMQILDGMRVVIRTEIDRALKPVVEDIREVKKKVDQ